MTQQDTTQPAWIEVLIPTRDYSRDAYTRELEVQAKLNRTTLNAAVGTEQSRIPALQLDELTALKANIEFAITQAQSTLDTLKPMLKEAQKTTAEMLRRKQRAGSAGNEGPHNDWKNSQTRARELESQIEVLEHILPDLRARRSACNRALDNTPQSHGFFRTALAHGKVQLQMAFDSQDKNRSQLRLNASKHAEGGNYDEAIYLLELLVKDDQKRIKKYQDWGRAVISLESLGQLAVIYEMNGAYYKALDTVESYITLLVWLSGTISWGSEQIQEIVDATKRAQLHKARLQTRIGRKLAAAETVAKVNADNTDMAKESWFDNRDGQILKHNIYTSLTHLLTMHYTTGRDPLFEF